MKISIRQGVFETNSSSVHAIVIDTSGNEDDKDSLRFYSGPVMLGYFGRDTGFVTDIESRLSYLWTAIWDLKTNYEDVYSYAKEDSSLYDTRIRIQNIPDLDWWKDRLSGFIMEFIVDQNPNLEDPDDIYFESEVPEVDDSYPYEYKEFLAWKSVDHVVDALPFLERLINDDELLKNYLFGKGSYVLVTNDEGGFSTDAPKVIDAELIMKSADIDDDDCKWNRFHEFPEEEKVIFLKGA